MENPDQLHDFEMYLQWGDALAKDQPDTADTLMSSIIEPSSPEIIQSPEN